MIVLDENISPQKIKKMSMSEKNTLAYELRKLIVDRVSKNGGHLASNLGTIELIIALHSVFDTPKDKIVFDVGHQAYAHKIITGRYKSFGGLRAKDGISGFPRPSESEHDAFIAGHSGISLSAALGISEAMLLQGSDSKVVSVIGDGAFTNGEIYEGLNNVSARNGNLIIILNDNEMSISKNSGAMANYLGQLRSSVKYHQTKTAVKSTLDRSNLGKGISSSISGAKRIVKSAIIPDNLFESLGFKYYGPVDGHNIEELTEVLEVAKMLEVPCFIHIHTKKGKGYTPAETNSGQHHAINKKETRVDQNITFSEVFGRELLLLGGADDKICAVTAAMKYATGCNYFAKQFRKRFFDVGIAEGHAVTFCAGLASQGMLPILAVYSTFLQRGIDQLIHDVAIEKLHLVLAVDRAGLIGEDGETHQGTFDVPLLMSVPNTTIFSPATADELRLCLEQAIYNTPNIAVVRYPRGYCTQNTNAVSTFYYSGGGHKRVVVTYGRMINIVNRLRKLDVDVIQLVQIKPIPQEAFEIIKGYSQVYFIEESLELGGVGESLLLSLSRIGWRGEFKLRGAKGFVPVGDLESQFKECGLDYDSLAAFVEKPTATAERKRLDIAMTELGIVKSRTQAQDLIKHGKVSVNDDIVTKVSLKVSQNDVVELCGELPRYVSRGGFKLEKAVNAFKIDVEGRVCLDVGASTGGFTDCLLQNGAAKVYAVDVGTSQLDKKLLEDERVVSFEQMDIRKADENTIPEKVDFVSIDVSFVSLKLVLPYIASYLNKGACCVALIKPQFEVGRKHIKNGIVRDEKQQGEVTEDIVKFTAELGYTVVGVIPTDLHGAEMNQEFLMYFRKE